MGSFWAALSNIESVSLVYVAGGVDLAGSKKLKQFHVETVVEDVSLRSCSNLINSILGNVGGGVDFRTCSNLIAATVGNAGLGVDFRGSNNLQIATLGNIGRAVNISGCKNVERVTVGSVGTSIDCEWCSGLLEIKIGDVMSSVNLRGCDKLSLAYVSSIYGRDKKIEVGSLLTILDSGINDLSDDQLLTKFVVRPNMIKRI